MHLARLRTGLLVQKWDLSRGEILQIVNLRPKYPVELALIAGHQSVRLPWLVLVSNQA